MNITHRDVKLENIILSKDLTHLKLIDFGFSTCVMPHKKLKIYCGTPSYMAPQIVQKQQYHGPPTDIWAAGVLLYTLFEGAFPFKGSSDKDLYRKISKGVWREPKHMPPDAEKFLGRLLCVNPEKRISASEALCWGWLG
jgi:MAP/microtubule affinity-regulating kinase